jgi:signal transduction histidine kinase/DNA-binding response OmpR family regulator/ligand-binding sensor domain-containing protein
VANDKSPYRDIARALRSGATALAFLVVSLQSLFAQEKLLPVIDFRRLTTADGLPSNNIRSNVVRDRQGFIWFGTDKGLVRYDGYACKIYPHFSYAKNALFLHVDTRGRLWVGTFGSGLSLYDPGSDRFVSFPHRPEDSTSLQAPNVNTICEDVSGTLWLVVERAPRQSVVWLDLGIAKNETHADSVALHARFHNMFHEGFRDGVWNVDLWDDTCAVVTTVHGVFICNRNANAVTTGVLPPVSGLDLDTVFVTSLFWETPRRLWIGTLLHGLYMYDRATGSLTAFHKRPAVPGRTRDDPIQGIQGDHHGRLWIYCDDSVDLFDPSSGVYRDYLCSTAGPGRSTYTRMSIDSAGIFWFPTSDNGLYFVPPASLRFPRYGLKGSSGRPMEMETINRWSDGSYWIGAEGKVKKIRLESLSVLETVDLFKGEKGEYGRVGVWSSHDDGRGRLWYGTWGLGLYSFEPTTGRVKNYRFPGPNVVMSIIGVGRDSLWIAEGSDAMLSFDTHTTIHSESPHIRGGHAVHLMKDREGHIWISDEARGLSVYDPSTSGWQHYGYDPGDPRGIRNANHQNTYQDRQGRIWVGRDTLALWEPATRSFKRFPNPVFGEATVAVPLGSDIRGRLWVQYPDKGLAILDPIGGEFVNFDRSDGVVGPIAMSPLPDGRVILVGYGGMNIVDGDSVCAPQHPPTLVITRVSINDTAVLPLQSISAATGLQLQYVQNVIEFGFAAIDPGATHRVDYLYRLEGLEGDWVRSNGRRYVRYPGLGPGHYLFRVRAVDRFARWPDQEIALAISMAPPWWGTRWAYGAYVILFMGLLYAGYHVRLRQVHLRQEVEMEHFQREHLAEVDRLKSRFFANISHEFRTPLTLILGAIHKWRDRAHEEGERKDLDLAERNSYRLLSLVNQLLDLAKLESGAMKVRASRLNIVRLVKGIAYSFESSAGLRGIDLSVVVEQEEIEVYCDREMVEKILTNLLSNAFKFTQDGGSVRVSVTELAPHRTQVTGDAGRGEEYVEIAVADTGVGIPSDQLDRVFDRFYQVDSSHTRGHEGSGLGLALVKELVELQHGTIQVRSEVGKGTTCTVRLPLGRAHLKDGEVVEVPDVAGTTMRGAEGALPDMAGGGTPGKTEPEEARGEKPLVLVVEDNADVRAYIRGYLAPAYHLAEARDGVEGIERALHDIPDLIICDVMMPTKDGYEVCRTLKHDEKTSHIPVILLTAKASSENKIEGLETGADEYLVKPFEPTELLARVKNLINVRHALRERFSAAVPLKPGEIAVTSIDDVFLRKVVAVVERRMGDEHLSVEELGREVGMSRSQLHRKLTALTGQSPSDFIRYMRLHRAMALLQGNAGTVAQVAYCVGFGDPSHFSRRFHEFFGVTPGEVRKLPGESLLRSPTER